MHKLRRFCAGVYRLTLTDERFGQIQREAGTDLWLAEIRETSTANLVRYAGKWKTLREAEDELRSINPIDL